MEQNPSKNARLNDDDDDVSIQQGIMSNDPLAPTKIETSILPLPILSRIANFNVGNTSHLARLRCVGRQFYRSVLADITATSTGGSEQFIQCPSNQRMVYNFIDELTVYPHFLFDRGDLVRLTENWTIMEGCAIQEFRVVDYSEEYKQERSNTAFNHTPLSIEKVFEACDALRAIQSFEQFRTVQKMIMSNGLMRPLSGSQTSKDGFVAFLTLLVSPEVARQKTQSHNERQWLQLKTPEEPTDDFGFFQHPNCSYIAPVISRDDDKCTAVVLVELESEYFYMDNRNEDHYDITNLRLDSTWEKAQNNTMLVEGIAIVDDFFAGRESLCAKIDALVKLQEDTSNVDFHPNTQNIVRNIVHPTLYCYVDKVTPLQRSMAESPPCTLSPEEPSVLIKEGKDFWGRSYENSVYQWLPTYFSVANNGCCTIDDYINNLVPRDNYVKAALYKDLELLFQSCLPFIESVYSYVRAIRPLIREEVGLEYDNNIPPPLNVQYCSLRGQKLQVITKIVDYELVREQIHTGVWHVEGMSHEEIVLTALYIADRDEEFNGADIEFKRAFLLPEAQYLFSTIHQDRFRAAMDMVQSGLVPLGKVATLKGRLIVFPNSHVHKVTDMSFLPSAEQTKSSVKRRIVVFFLVNPFRRIISTREVAPQQISCGGNMSLDDALVHRLQLMHERRHTKQDWNVRDIELCEH